MLSTSRCVTPCTPSKKRGKMLPAIIGAKSPAAVRWSARSRPSRLSWRILLWKPGLKAAGDATGSSVRLGTLARTSVDARSRSIAHAWASAPPSECPVTTSCVLRGMLQRSRSTACRTHARGLPLRSRPLTPAYASHKGRGTQAAWGETSRSSRLLSSAGDAAVPSGRTPW